MTEMVQKNAEVVGMAEVAEAVSLTKWLMVETIVLLKAMVVAFVLVNEVEIEAGVGGVGAAGGRR